MALTDPNNTKALTNGAGPLELMPTRIPVEGGADSGPRAVSVRLGGPGSGKSLSAILPVILALGALQQAAGVPGGFPGDPLGDPFAPLFPPGFLPERGLRGLFPGETFEVTAVHEQNPADDNRRAVVTIQIKSAGEVVKTYTGAVLQKLTEHPNNGAGETAGAYRFVYNGKPVFITCDCHPDSNWQAALDKCATVVNAVEVAAEPAIKMLWFLDKDMELSEVAAEPVEGSDGEFYIPAKGEYGTFGEDLFETELDACEGACGLLQEVIETAVAGIAFFSAKAGHRMAGDDSAPRIAGLRKGLEAIKTSPNFTSLPQVRVFAAVKLLQDTRAAEAAAEA